LVQRLPVVPGQRLLGVLDVTDLIKFARERSTAERAREIGAEARGIVADTNAALVAAAAAAAKAKAA
jgi:CBS domain-containing protein